MPPFLVFPDQERSLGILRPGAPGEAPFGDSGVDDFAATLLLQVEAVQGHYLGPGRDEGLHEVFLGISGGVELGYGAQLGVGAEDQVDRSGRPLDLTRGAVATFVNARGGGLGPLG